MTKRGIYKIWTVVTAVCGTMTLCELAFHTGGAYRVIALIYTLASTAMYLWGLVDICNVTNEEFMKRQRYSLDEKIILKKEDNDEH